MSWPDGAGQPGGAGPAAPVIGDHDLERGQGAPDVDGGADGGDEALGGRAVVAAAELDPDGDVVRPGQQAPPSTSRGSRPAPPTRRRATARTAGGCPSPAWWPPGGSGRCRRSGCPAARQAARRCRPSACGIPRASPAVRVRSCPLPTTRLGITPRTVRRRRSATRSMVSAMPRLRRNGRHRGDPADHQRREAQPGQVAVGLPGAGCTPTTTSADLAVLGMPDRSGQQRAPRAAPAEGRAHQQVRDVERGGRRAARRCAPRAAPRTRRAARWPRPPPPAPAGRGRPAASGTDRPPVGSPLRPRRPTCS